MLRTFRLLTIFSVLSSLAAVPAAATTTRVDTIAQRGLLPDAEEDVNQVPAFIHDVDGSRLFADGTFNWLRSKTGQSAAGSWFSTRSKDTDSAASAEYVTKVGAFPLAVQYSPSYSDDRILGSSSIAGPTQQVNVARNALSPRVILGFGAASRWKGAVFLQENEIYQRLDIGGPSGDNLEKGAATTGGVSVLRGEKGGPRLALGLDLTSIRSRQSIDQKTTFDRGDTIWNVKAVPELPGSGGVWRLLAQAGQTFDNHHAPNSANYSIKRGTTYSLGAGWTRPTENGVLWHADVLYTGNPSVSRSNLRTEPDTSESRLGILRAGFEWDASPKVVLRAALDPVAYQFLRSQVPGTSASKESTFSFNLRESLGIGFRTSEDVMVDVSFLRLAGFMDHNATFNSITGVTSSNEAAWVLAAALDYRFH